MQPTEFDAVVAERSDFRLGTAFKQAAWLAVLIPAMLAVAWAIPSASGGDADGVPGSPSSWTPPDRPDEPPREFVSAADPDAVAHLVLVDSEESKADFALSLHHEFMVRAALREGARVSWVVVAGTDEEAAIIAAAVLDQNVPELTGGRELRVTDLRSR